MATGFCASPSLLVALISSASLETCPLLDAVCFPSHRGTQPAPVAQRELFNWAQAEALKTVDAVCGSCPHSPQCANMPYSILLVGLYPWAIRMTRVQERRSPRGNVFVQWFVRLILGISRGKGSPCSAVAGYCPRGDGGWLQKALGVC